MQVQSLSVVAPTNGCVNNCKFCVSKLHENDYGKRNKLNNAYEFSKRLQFARDNNCNTVMLTGTGEPLQNKKFLEYFANINISLRDPFQWIELQTSGVMLSNRNLTFLKSDIFVDTISLSISDIFDSKNNAEICGIKPKLYFDIDKLCKVIKEYDFNLRLSLNLSNVYNNHSPKDIFRRAKDLGADQVTLRKLYSSERNTTIDSWIKENAMEQNAFARLREFVFSNGEQLETLPFGAVKYGYDEMGVVVDEDCMSEKPKDVYKYLILRENCRLYSKWDNKSSLIF